MSKGGIPLRTSLIKLKEKFEDMQVQTLASAIGDGMAISEAFDKAGFSEFEINLIHAGERSGRLEDIYGQLSYFWRQEEKLVGNLWRQALYPIVLLHLAVFFYPLPSAVATVQSSGVFVAAFYYFVSVSFLLFMLYLVAFSLYMIVSQIWRSPGGQLFLLKVPLVGRAWKATYAFRWIFALRLEHDAGIPLSDAVYDAWQATGFAERDAPAEQGKAHILAGEPLSTVFPSWKTYLPLEWVDYIETGEVSGKLSDTFRALEEQAIHESSLASAALNEWLPRIFLVCILIMAVGLLFSAFFSIFYQAYTLFDTIPK